MATTHFSSLSINPIHHFHSNPITFPTFPRTHQSIRRPIITNCTTTTNNGGFPTPDPQNQSSINNNKPLPPFAEPPQQDEEQSLPFSTTLNNIEYPIEKQRRSEIHREEKRKKSQRELLKPDTPPPNYEIGWKRTKEVMKQIEKPVGYTIMDFIEKLEILITLRQFGSTELLAKVGEIVAERVREEAELLKEEGKVEERMVTELFRVLRLMEMDLAMVKGAVKEETLEQRLEQAKARCRQAILVAASF